MNQTIGSGSLERVSALVDGQLEGDEFARAVGDVGTQDELRASWQVYHLVGDVLRSGAHAPCAESGAFMARLQQRLASEEVVRPVVPQPAVQPARIAAEAANEPVFRWKMVAGVATVAAAAAIGWTWMGQGPSAVPAAGTQLAQQQQSAPAQVQALAGAGGASVLASANNASTPSAPMSRTRVMVGNGNPQVMLRDPRLDELLEAHQQASGVSQMPGGFLRNATFEAPSR